jgi:hypothetical protein
MNDEVRCPMCDGPMWDNREKKRNPKAPDFKCKDRDCEGVIWPERKKAAASAPTAAPRPAPITDDRLTQAALRIAGALEVIAGKLSELKWTAPLSKKETEQYAYEADRELDDALDRDALSNDEEGVPF